MKILLALLMLPLVFSQGDPRRDLARAKLEERNLLREVQEIDTRLLGVERELDDLRDRADELERERRVNEDELAAAEAALEDRAGELREWLLALYHLQRRGFARIIFSADDPGDLRRRAYYLMSVLTQSRTRAQRYLDHVDVKEKALERVELDRAALGALQGEVRLREAELRDERARKLALLQDVRADRELALQMLSEQARAGRDVQQLTRGTYSAPIDTGCNMRQARGNLPWPVTGPLLRGFGPYTDEATGQQAQSDGISIRAARYTPFRAICGGVVERVSQVPAYGLVVIVAHDKDWKSVYAHASKVQVSPGQSVSTGDALGLVGETGLTDSGGPRLHFQMYYKGQHQNPLFYLRKGG